MALLLYEAAGSEPPCVKLLPTKRILMGDAVCALTTRANAKTIDTTAVVRAPMKLKEHKRREPKRHTALRATKRILPDAPSSNEEKFCCSSGKLGDQPIHPLSSREMASACRRRWFDR